MRATEKRSANLFGETTNKMKPVFTVNGKREWIRTNTDMLMTIVMMAEKAARYDEKRVGGGESKRYREIANGITRAIVKTQTVETTEADELWSEGQRAHLMDAETMADTEG